MQHPCHDEQASSSCNFTFEDPEVGLPADTRNDAWTPRLSLLIRHDEVSISSRPFLTLSPGGGPEVKQGFVAHGEAGVSRGTASRLRNGIALQGNTPLPRLRNGTSLQVRMRTASEGIRLHTYSCRINRKRLLFFDLSLIKSQIARILDMPFQVEIARCS
jgi:hypothetical protein